MAVTTLHWTWEEAFDKYGFDDGDGTIMTHAVASVLEQHGYETSCYSVGVHNTIIFAMTGPDGATVFDEDTIEPGISNPRTYLPADVVALLDAAFSDDAATTLEVGEVTIKAYMEGDTIIIDAYTGTSTHPIATTRNDNR